MSKTHDHRPRSVQPLGAIPTDPAAFDTVLVQRILATFFPEVELASVTLKQAWEWGAGEQVSTSGRLALKVEYADDECSLPRDIILKIARPELPAFPLYRNEVAAYTQLRPWEFMRTPTCIGAWFDESSGSFGLALDDLSKSGATFPNALTQLPIDRVQAALSEIAKLHARHWGERADWKSPALNWAQSHVSGDLHDLFDHPELVPAMIADEVQLRQHKRELLMSAGESPASLLDHVRAVQAHQATLPQTLVHGDAHVGNHFITASHEVGLLDWQLSVRGYYMHDVSYTIVTSLDVDTRRVHERRLVELHLDELARLGATNLPSPDEAFEEYRRAQAWNTYIGWLICPVENYGWEINVANHIRLLTAYRDLDSRSAIEAIK